MSEITARRTVLIFALAVGAALWLLAASLLWRTQVPADLELPRLDPRSQFSAAQLDETADYARVARALWIVSNLTQLVVLGLLAWLGPRLAVRLPGGRLRRGLTLLIIVLAAVWVARLPVRAVSHWWRRRHGLSEQGYFDWLTAPWLELTAGVVIAWVALAVAMLLAQRLGRRWWLAGAPVLAIVGAGVVLIQPLIDFRRLEPLQNRALAAEIRALAREVGVGWVDVDVKDASERTTTANAEVTGLGPTRRVVLWDTLLDGRFTPGEIRFIVAHELAHVARRHVWKGVSWFALLVLPCVFVLAEVTRRRGGIAEPAVVPLAVLTVVALQLAVLPIANVVSRRYEAEADWVALEATKDPASMQRLMRRFSETSLAQPEPPTWSYVLRSTHPSLLERIAMARAWP
jgi:STE24 endopeptidase